MYSSILPFPFLISYFVFLIPYFNGRPPRRHPQLQHEPYPGKRYPAGDACAQVPARAGVPVPAACKGFTWKAGYGTPKIQNRHFYTWLLLAWA